MRVLLTAAGTRGDVQPLLALGHTLLRRGHQVRVAAAPCFARDAAAVGLQFVPMGRDIEAWIKQESKTTARNPVALWRMLNRAIEGEMQAQFDVLPGLAKGADVVLAAGALVAGSSAAAAAGVPFRYVAYTNQTIPSGENVPALLPFQGLPAWLNRLWWFLTAWFYDRLLLRAFNARRRQLGLADARQLIDEFLPRDGLVLAADPELSPPPADFPVPITGAWSLDDRRPLPSELEAFLRAGAPPVFAGFGSMPDQDPAATGALFAAAARALGRRLIIAGNATLPPSPEVFVLSQPVSHARLFRRVCAVVHHGGAGTTASAARAGAPQVIVPHGGDQFGFARWAHQLGIAAAPIPRGRLTAEGLERALAEVMERALDVRAWGARFAARPDGTVTMALSLEADVQPRLHDAGRTPLVEGSATLTAPPALEPRDERGRLTAGSR